MSVWRFLLVIARVAWLDVCGWVRDNRVELLILVIVLLGQCLLGWVLGQVLVSVLHW